MLGGQPLIHWSARAGRAIAAAHHWLIAPTNAPFDAKALGYEPLINPAPQQGMATSLNIAAQAAEKAQADALLILLADMPFIRPAHLHKLLASHEADPARPIFSVAPDGVPQPPALFPSSCFAMLAALEGDKGARALSHNAAIIACPADQLFDVDSADDLAQAASIARQIST